MSDRKVTNLFAVILGCSMLAAGTTAAFAASDTSQPTHSDAQITHRVFTAINNRMSDSIVGLKVETQNGVVTLSGRAETGITKLKAEQTARRVPGVTDVKDHLRIAM